MRPVPAVERAERIPSRIEGLDSLIEGGFIRGDLILLAGHPGSGKSTLCTQFACNVAQNGERVLYASFEEDARTLKRNMGLLGFNLLGLEGEGKLKLIDPEVMSDKVSGVDVDYMLGFARSLRATVLILDSLSAFLLAFKEKFEARTVLHLLYGMLKAASYTTLVTLSIPYGTNSLGLGVEEAVADSLVLLENRVEGIDLQTRMLIYKMRGTNHSRKYHRVMMERGGISVLPYME